MLPWNGPSQKETSTVFQSSIFRCYCMLVSGRVVPRNLTNGYQQRCSGKMTFQIWHLSFGIHGIHGGQFQGC